MDRRPWLRYVAAALFVLLTLNAGSTATGTVRAQNSRGTRSIRVDAARKVIRVANGDLRFRVTYDRRCLIDSLWIGNTLLSGVKAGGLTGCRIDSTWYTTRRLIDQPLVSAFADSVTIRNIRYAAGRYTVSEEWSFALHQNEILWTIDRTLPKPLILEDNAFPVLQIDSMDMFDGALLGMAAVRGFGCSMILRSPTECTPMRPRSGRMRDRHCPPAGLAARRWGDGACVVQGRSIC